MQEFLTIVFSFPTIVFTALLIAALVYWALVIFGSLDIDILDIGGAAEGAVDGAIESAADAAAEGAAEAIEGAQMGADADGAAHSTGWILSGAVQKVPMTVALSLLIFFGFVLSYLAVSFFSHRASSLVPAWLFGIAVLIAALLLAFPIASVAARPLGSLFVTHAATRLQELVGDTCRILTGTVDGAFGQAVVGSGGNEHTVQVRCDRRNELRRGDEALIVAYDPKREAFRIEPLEAAPGSGSARPP